MLDTCASNVTKAPICTRTLQMVPCWLASGEDFKPDFAALFPIPKRYQTKPKRPAKRAKRSAKQEEKQQPEPADSEDQYEGDFWISPRMAARLHHAGCLYVDIWLGDDDSPEYWDDLPGVAQPYAKQQGWKKAYRQAPMRIVRRLEKGLLPYPNCTGVLTANGAAVPLYVPCQRGVGGSV
jgi:hypothetical protein